MPTFSASTSTAIDAALDDTGITVDANDQVSWTVDGASEIGAAVTASGSGALAFKSIKAALGATTAAVEQWTNTTAAAAGAQQVSPATRWTGQGWKTDATAASQTVDFQAYVLPVQGAAAPTATWVLQYQVAAGGFATALSVTSAGALYVPTAIELGHATQNTLSASGGVLSIEGNVIYHQGGALGTPASGTLTGIINTDTKFCTTQFDADDGSTGNTLTDIVGMTGFTLAAGATYKFDIFINGLATANGGHQIAIQLNTATLTSLNAGAQALLAASTAFTQTTDAADPCILHAATTATLGIRISGRLIVGTGGTCDIQAAQNVTHADNSLVYVGSWATFTRVA